MDEVFWSVGRTSGMLSLCLLTAALLLGIVTRSGRPLAGLSRYVLTLLHRNATLLALGFVLVHFVSLWLDPQARLRLGDLAVPFLGSYRPFWQGLGTLALLLLLAVGLSGLLRRRIGQRAFTAVHWLAYALWPIAVAHGLGNGTDAASWWYRTAALASILLVCAAVLWRLSANYHDAAATRRASRKGVMR